MAVKLTPGLLTIALSSINKRLASKVPRGHLKRLKKSRKGIAGKIGATTTEAKRRAGKRSSLHRSITAKSKGITFIKVRGRIIPIRRRKK